MYIEDFEGATISKIELGENDYDYTSIKLICTNGLELLILPDSPARDHWLTITTAQPRAQPSKVPEAIAHAVLKAKDALVKLDAGQDIDGILEAFKTLAECWADDVINGQAQAIIGKPGDQVQLSFCHVNDFFMNSKKFDALVSAGVLEVEPVEQWKGGKNWYVSCAVLMDALEEVEAL